MKKAIYLPTGENTVILRELDDYYEILLDGKFKTVSQNEVKITEASSHNVPLERLAHAILGDILSVNRLVICSTPITPTVSAANSSSTNPSL